LAPSTWRLTGLRDATVPGGRGADTCLPELRRRPLPGRGHQPRRPALLPLPAQPAHGGRAAGRARHHGQPRLSREADQRAPVGAEVRARLRQPGPPQAAGGGNKWHLDEAVPTIAGVKRWLWRAVDQTASRLRRTRVLDILGAGPVRRAGRQAPAAQAAAAVPGTSCHGHRQAGELWRGQALGDAPGRAREAQGGGDFAPADPAAGAAGEALQVAWPGAAPPSCPRRDQQSSPPSPPPSARHPASSRPDSGLSGLGQGHRRRRCGVTTTTST